MNVFDKPDPGNLPVCKEYYMSLSSDKIPEASLAKGFWVEKYQAISRIRRVTAVERPFASKDMLSRWNQGRSET